MFIIKFFYKEFIFVVVINTLVIIKYQFKNYLLIIELIESNLVINYFCF